MVDHLPPMTPQECDGCGRWVTWYNSEPCILMPDVLIHICPNCTAERESEMQAAKATVRTVQATTAPVVVQDLEEFANRERNVLDFRAKMLGFDELRVLNLMAQGLIDGKPEYGDLSLATSTRDWEDETNQELRDGIIYQLFQMLKERL